MIPQPARRSHNSMRMKHTKEGDTKDNWKRTDPQYLWFENFRWKKRPNLEENPQPIVTVAASFMRNKIKCILSLNRYIKLHSISVIVFDYGTRKVYKIVYNNGISFFSERVAFIFTFISEYFSLQLPFYYAFIVRQR